MSLTGDEIDYTELLPKELQALRKKLATYAGGKVGQSNTPYLGPMSTGLDPMSLMAANIMMAYGNQLPYTSPTMFYGSEMTPWGTQATGLTGDVTEKDGGNGETTARESGSYNNRGELTKIRKEWLKKRTAS